MVALAYNWLKSLRGEEGQTAVEYGVLVALILAVSIAVITALGLDVLEAFNKVEDVVFGNDA